MKPRQEDLDEVDKAFRRAQMEAAHRTLERIMIWAVVVFITMATVGWLPGGA